MLATAILSDYLPTLSAKIITHSLLTTSVTQSDKALRILPAPFQEHHEIIVVHTFNQLVLARPRVSGVRNALPEKPSFWLDFNI